MSDANDNEGRSTPSPAGPRAPLSLKPRSSSSLSAGTVKQSFSHGRTKTVVVETKRRRFDPPGAPAHKPAPAAFEVKRPAPAPAAPRPAAPAAPTSTDGLSNEEAARRARVVEAARVDAERRDAERQAEEARRAEAAARAAEARAQVAATPAPVAAAPAPATPTPTAAAPAPQAAQAAAPAPQPQAAPAPAAEASRPAPRAEAPRPAREEPPARDRYHGGFRPSPRADAPRPAGPAREGRENYRPDGRRDDRSGGTTTFRAAPREGVRPQGDRPGRPGERPRPSGPETVRYSALSPRPAGPRPPRIGAGAGAPPAGPEIQRAARQAPRAGDHRRPSERDEEEVRRAKAGANAPGKAISRVKGAPQRREGRLTIQTLAGDEESAERMRSLASVRRAREREKEKRKGGSVEQAKAAREVVIPDVITVQELAQRMATRGVEVIKFLMRQGVMLKINDVIDNDTAELVATEFGHTVRRVSEADVEEGFLAAEDVDDHVITRPPVVTVMGHVDHGKTSLLDALRSTDVAAGEHGGITQHIGAYQVRLKNGERVTFLDTPGHAAFSAMRARGANITDIVVLVVAADDGVMPQTIEAIHHAKAAGAPIIVAINKMDRPDADPTRVINELLQHEIVVESLGGETQVVEVSALKKTGLDDLVENILLQAEVLDLKANPDRTAEGVVIESKLDKGRGPVGTVLVKRGTLKRGDIVVAGSAWGKVRALVDERNQQLPEAGPSVPVEILGLDAAPEPGEPFAVVENEARARELTDYRDRKRRERNMAPVGATGSLADMMAKLQDKKVSELPLVIKGDVQGSVEAIVGSLDKISTDEVRARIILSGAGAISESDVMLAKGAGSPILGFNVRASKQARDLAEREGVELRYYSIIYDLLDDIKGVLSGMLAPLQRETFLGNAEVLQAFDISKVGKVAGCRVTEGVVRKGAKVRIVRENVVVLELGTLQTLKRFKDEVNEVQSGQECGMQFAGFQDIREGDTIECFTVEVVARSL
ncbi:MAG TPA: translation initiation factor IF-2 [Caulobacteraceae bacterium]